ncbi:MAG: DMT family transporter [Hyphomicrobiaceae bacterium]
MTAGTSTLSTGRSVGMAVTLAAALALAINNVTLPFVYKSGWNAQSVVLFRFIFSSTALGLVLLLGGRGFALSRRDIAHAMGSGVAVAIGAIGLLGSFQFIPVSLAIVVVYTNPVLTAVMLAIWHRHPPSFLQIVCLIVAFAGVAVATGIGDVTLDPRGIALAIMSAIGFSFSFAWNSVKLRAADAMTVTFYMVIAGGIATAAFVLLSGTLSLPAVTYGWLLFLIPACCFSFAMFGMYEGVRRIGGAPAAMLMNLEPVMTIALAPFVLGEHLTAMHIIGGLLVIGAVYVSERSGEAA